MEQKKENIDRVWGSGKKVLYPHLMSSINLRFEYDSYRKLYKNNLNGYSDRMYNELENIFKKYGIKSVDLTYNLFNTSVEETDEMRILKYDDLFGKE